MSTQRKQSKSLNKIHRRKNQEIQKGFECTEEGCNKAYGSYAALYTHIKNKHANAKLPQMKTNIVKNKTGKKGRPQAKEIQPLKEEQSQGSVVECKLCHKSDCVCVEDYDSQEKNKTIEIMKNQDFVNLITEIGNLSIDDKFTWVRNTEQDFAFLSQKDIQNMIAQFNKKYHGDIRFSQKIIEILSFTSRYWDSKLLNELYQSLFVIRLKKGRKQILETFQKEKEVFERMMECAQVKKDEFQQLCNLIKLI